MFDASVVEPVAEVVVQSNLGTECWHAIVLGAIQGLTEFLPVSSSGHLEIGKFILGDNKIPEESMLMTVVLHFATALSTCLVFRKEILQILKGLFQFRWNEEAQFSAKIVLSMIPAVVVGVGFEKEIEALFDKQLLLVGMMLVITAILLLLADRAKRTEKHVGWLDALIIGVSQAIAILPGISRSGATISTSVLLGVDREKAARFSFLMVVPLIFGYIAKKLLREDWSGEGVEWLPLTLGFVAAFLTGWMACLWMIALVKRAKLSWFAVYCFIVAAIAIGWAWRYGA